MPDALSCLAAAVVRTFDIGKGVAEGDRRKVTAPSAVLALLSTTVDDVSDWLRAGRALSHVLLTLTAAGVTRARRLFQSAHRGGGAASPVGGGPGPG